MFELSEYEVYSLISKLILSDELQILATQLANNTLQTLETKEKLLEYKGALHKLLSEQPGLASAKKAKKQVRKA